MCGRYKISGELSEHGKRIRFQPLEFAFAPRYNVAPTQQAPVVLAEGGNRVCRLLRWGLIPSWAKDESAAYKMINARAETVAEKPGFRVAFRQRRCLVLADGFYEWKKVGAGKVPHLFSRADDGPFAFAGLWERWKKPEGEDLLSFTIITTEPNELARTVHDRMPVILPETLYDQWLDPKVNEAAALQGLLKPYAAEPLKVCAVSSVVSNARNEGPQCIAPASGGDDMFTASTSVP